MKRLIKHNQLKPLKPPTLAGLNEDDKAISEDQNTKKKSPVVKKL